MFNYAGTDSSLLAVFNPAAALDTVASDWRADGLCSYARVSVGNEGDNSGSSASDNSDGLTAYAAYDGDPWYPNLAAAAARQQYSTDRAVSFSGNNYGSFNGMVDTTSRS